MNKAFTRESEEEDEDGEAPGGASLLPAGSKNYMTPACFARLKDELDRLLGKERPELVAVIAWAAGNGDRSENGDYIYGKKRLREMDRRIRFLGKRLDAAEVVDPQARRDDGEEDRVYFGATVTVRNARNEDRTVSIVGVDEIDTARGYISWVSPMARALLKAREGDIVMLNTPGGVEELEILEVRYERLAPGTPTMHCAHRRRGPPRLTDAARAATIQPWTRILPNSSASWRRSSRTRARCAPPTSRCAEILLPRTSAIATSPTACSRPARAWMHSLPGCLRNDHPIHSSRRSFSPARHQDHGPRVQGCMQGRRARGIA